MQVQLFCFLASYLSALLSELLRVKLEKPWLRWVTLGFIAAGLVAHTWYLTARSYQTQLPPLLASNHDWLLVSAWLLVAAYLVQLLIAWRKSTVSSWGIFVLPLALLLVLASSLLNQHSTESFGSQRLVTMLHASSLSLGITGVLIGFLISLMYLIQHRRLKKKQNLSTGFSLPPLSTLARYNRWTVIIAFPLLTIGLITGFLLIVGADQSQNEFSWSDPFIVGFTAIWGVMIMLFGWLLKSHSSHGKQLALLNAWAFGFLIVTLLGLQILVSVTGIPSQHSDRDPSKDHLAIQFAMLATSVAGDRDCSLIGATKPWEEAKLVSHDKPASHGLRPYELASKPCYPERDIKRQLDYCI